VFGNANMAHPLRAHNRSITAVSMAHELSGLGSTRLIFWIIRLVEIQIPVTPHRHDGMWYLPCDTGPVDRETLQSTSHAQGLLSWPLAGVLIRERRL
jgi:hypothetical protein